ncbi:MAG: 23S rRNA (guanosine(2251)-2'-O)-methyltransferase RlmB [Pseudomonadota bacterium]
MSRSRYVTGLRAVEQLLATDPSSLKRVYIEYRSKNPRVEAIEAALNDAGIELHSANRARLTQMSGETRHQGVVAEIRRDTMLDEAGLRSLVEARLEAGDKLLLLVLDGIQDPHNLGACLRTADATGVDAVVVPRHASASLGPTVSKVAAGAAERVPFAQVANLGRVMDWLGDYGVLRIATSDGADDELYDVNLNRSVALVMGREETGVKSGLMKRCDVTLKLPMAGAVSSLNVSVATAVCLYEVIRQRR